MFKVDSMPEREFRTFDAAAGALLGSGNVDGCRVEISTTGRERARFLDRAGVRVDAIRHEPDSPTGEDAIRRAAEAVLVAIDCGGHEAALERSNPLCVKTLREALGHPK